MPHSFKLNVQDNGVVGSILHVHIFYLFYLINELLAYFLHNKHIFYVYKSIIVSLNGIYFLY